MTGAPTEGLHWAAGYLGRAWVPGEHDCWGFVRAVWRERWGLEVPALAVDAQRVMACARAVAAEREAPVWRPVESGQAREGDAVLLARGGYPTHVGLWLELGGVLHCLQGVGVVFTPVGQLAAQGWPHRRLYRHRSLEAAA